MEHEVNRFNSFAQNWPLKYIKPVDLAKSGFFYLQSTDKVQCAFCHVIIDDWNVGQKPSNEHFKKSQKCPFLLSATDVGNVPITEHPNRKREMKINNNNNYYFTESVTYKPKHSRMADLKKRLETYRYWPVISQSIQQLAECGFFYIDIEDHVECFFCGGRVGDWEPFDNPWKVHSKLYPRCGFVNLEKKHKGDGKMFPSVISSSPCEVSNDKEACINQTHNHEEMYLCKICMDRQMATVYQPCGHVVTCFECAQNILMCSLCRSSITNKIKIYLS